MHLPFLNRSNIKSPLRSILSTSGLVACYYPGLQVDQSLTGQTLLDYSPAGNHAQLGSTAGADTNDPSWGTNALTFGGDDYCVTPDIGNGDMTAFTVYKINTETSLAGLALFSRGNIRVYFVTSINSIYCGITREGGISYLDGGVATRNAWHINTFRLRTLGTPAWGVATTSIGTLATIGYTPTNSTQFGMYVARGASDYFMEGDIACHVMFNRVLGDNEASRVRANIVALMNGQGVVIA